VQHADVAITTRVGSAPGAGWSGVNVRKTEEEHTALDSGYLALIRPGSAGRLTLYVGGLNSTGSALISVDTLTDPSLAPVELRLEARGDNLKVLVDGVLHIDFDDPIHPGAGYASLA
jgi:hypothetical protein